jgi:phage repressor protein C with HTH and peptisase S24 domain
MTNIKERVLQVSDYYKVKKEKFFEELKLSYANFKGIQKNSALSSDAIDIILSKYSDISAEWLVTGRGSMLKQNTSPKQYEENHSSSVNMVAEPSMNVFKLKTDQIMMKQAVPLYDIQASASIVSLFRDSNSEKPVDHISIPNLPKCDGAIYVSGDSMYPLLKSGDIIMYKKLSSSIDNIFWGEMYLVSLVNDDGDEFVMVNWVQKSEKGEDYIKLVSENRHHQPKDFHLKNIKGLALIKASVRVNSMY